MPTELSDLARNGAELETQPKSGLSSCEDLKGVGLDRLSWEDVQRKGEQWCGRFLFKLSDMDIALKGTFFLPKGYETALQIFEGLMKRQPEYSTQQTGPQSDKLYLFHPSYHPFPFLDMVFSSGFSERLITSLYLCAVIPPLRKPLCRKNMAKNYKLKKGWSKGLVLHPANMQEPSDDAYDLKVTHRIRIDRSDEHYAFVKDSRDNLSFMPFVKNIPIALDTASKGVIDRESLCVNFEYYLKEGQLVSPRGRKIEIPRYAFNHK